MSKLRIKETAKEHGMSLTALADRLDIKPSSLSQAMSRNSFSVDKLQAIADAIGCDIVDLFDKPHNGIVCPHCGKPLSVHLS